MDFYSYEDEQPPRGASLMRQRMLAVVTALVVVLGASFLVAQVALTDPSPGTPQARVQAAAVGVVVQVPGKAAERIAVAQPVVGGRTKVDVAAAQYRYPADGSLVQASRVWVRASVNDAGRNVASRVDAGSVDLLGGRVRLESASLRANAGIARGRASGGFTLADGARLVIDGRSVPLRPNHQVVINGVGTVSIDEQAVVSQAPTGDRQTGPRYRITGSLVHVRLTRPYRGLPAGTEVMIGQLEAGVREGKVEAIAHPTPGATPVPSNIPGGVPSLQTGTPKPGDAEVPRRSTSVRANGGASAGNLQGYVFPILGATNYSNDYGAPRASTGRGHEGNDIFAAEGTPIVALADGVLDRVGWNSIGGYRFWLYDAYGNAFYHAHLSAFSPLALDGARVRAGDVIGFVGHTGDAAGTPPHLHFEVHPGNGGPTNPFPFLNAWKRGVAIAIDALGLGSGSDRLAPLTLLGSSDISPNSGLAESILETVPDTSPRPVEEEHKPVPTDESLAAAIDGAGISGN